MTLNSTIRTSGLLAIGVAALAAACNDHPIQPLNKVVSAANNTEVSLPAKTKLDLLFLIDNSGSMCQEQANLVKNFGLLSGFLYDELGESADYRIAVINTDLRTANSRGRFQDAPPGVSSNCKEAAGGLDCSDLLIDPRQNKKWTFGSVLKSGTEARGGNIGNSREDLEHRFSCLATLGTVGDGFEKGLEAIRLGLSCEGPNKDKFAQCCVDVLNEKNEIVKSTYDRNCAQRLEPGDEPEFLRPDAILVVVTLSDEVDCSDPASNPKASRRAICKYGPTDGTDADALPDGFQDPVLCPGRDAAACFRNECDALTPEQCYKTRCLIDRADNNNCEWHPEALTPVRDYVDFLKELKVDPNSKVIVASIVGNRGFVEFNGKVVETSNRQGRPTEECWYYEENGMPNVNVSQIDPVCCPNGICTGGPAPTCESLNGKAFNGRRYLELAEAFDINGIGCPVGAPENGEPCISICEDDFKRPLQTIKDRIVKVLGHYCLDKVPQCVTQDPAAPNDPLRPCETDEERSVLENYKGTVHVSLQCIHTQEQGGACDAFEPLHDLGADGFIIERDGDCASQLSITLTNPPPAGAEIFLRFRVDVSESGAFSSDDAGTGEGPDLDLGAGSDSGGVILEADGSGVILPPSEDGGVILVGDGP